MGPTASLVQMLLQEFCVVPLTVWSLCSFALRLSSPFLRIPGFSTNVPTNAVRAVSLAREKNVRTMSPWFNCNFWLQKGNLESLNALAVGLSIWKAQQSRTTFLFPVLADKTKCQSWQAKRIDTRDLMQRTRHITTIVRPFQDLLQRLNNALAFTRKRTAFLFWLTQGV